MSYYIVALIWIVSGENLEIWMRHRKNRQGLGGLTFLCVYYEFSVKDIKFNSIAYNLVIPREHTQKKFENKW